MRTFRLAVLTAACLVGTTHMVQAQTAPAETAPTTPPAAAETAPTPAAVPQVPMVAPSPAEEGMDLRKQPEEEKSVTETWWFWAAAGGVVVTTVAIVLVAGRSQTEPKTTLGDMRAFR